ncbi:MAG: hypothetical protein ACP5M5_05890 [Acidibrevibacterium sp.]|uniref:hypothetical protein n=1 Tax=Acidibrevibacterium sp. TaxID=2606776 RepID=UPI003D003661
MNGSHPSVRRIVKLGGSQAASPRLRAWLALVAATPGTLVVPGGGPFADTVRAEQAVLGYDEQAAHEMAMLAMAQFGRALCALAPALTLAPSLDHIARICGAGGVAVAVPWPLLATEAELPASWDVTSDSIALWFARRLAAPLLLIKSVSAAPGANLAALAALGVIDRFFPSLAAGFRFPIHLAGPADLPAGRALDPAHLPGAALCATQFA